MEGSEALLSNLYDVTGKVHLESEDPRWSALFRSKSYLPKVMQCIDMQAMAKRLRSNNLSTGNFLLLLDHTAARVKQTLSHLNKYSYIARLTLIN